ncbi:hypothetical protein [Deinococcus sp. LM3]|uniref:hypothetical protein n=1 Tax=Deinococcus sp. LM3 TaxID=1938608 RepID=UPI001F0A47F8|nr:hypothetical protein [Deinococcus sp. LM3]
MEFWTISLAPLFNDEMERLATQFEQQNPNVDVKWVDVPANAIEQNCWPPSPPVARPPWSTSTPT